MREMVKIITSKVYPVSKSTIKLVYRKLNWAEATTHITSCCNITWLALWLFSCKIFWHFFLSVTTLRRFMGGTLFR